jgi:hypothetical protein
MYMHARESSAAVTTVALPMLMNDQIIIIRVDGWMQI